MDKKNKKKGVIKRKIVEQNIEVIDSKKQKAVAVVSPKDHEIKEVNMKNNVSEAVAVPVDNSQQIIHTGQLAESFEQPVFVNMKGEPVQLGPNTVIVYEQSGNTSNFSFGGNLVMDSSGRIVMTDALYDVKGEPGEDNHFIPANTANEVEVESSGQFQQFIAAGAPAAGQEFEVSIIQEQPQDVDDESGDQEETVNKTTTLDETSLRWLNQKYDFVVRKLQLNYDAGVKLLHSPTGILQCIYFTTPTMQQAFNAVPQFLCIETSIEFTSNIPAQSSPTHSTHVTLFLAEDGNGRSVIVSAGITIFGDNTRWLLETFKSCNPAWRQVRCVVAEPTKHTDAIRMSFPSAHVTCSAWQAAREAAARCAPLARRLTPAPPYPAADVAARVKAYVMAVLRADTDKEQALDNLRRGFLGPNTPPRLTEMLSRPNGPLCKLNSWLEGENYTNVLHKGLERLTGRFTAVTCNTIQPDDFITFFFNVALTIEEERKNYAINRLRETEEAKQSPTDTITQYAYNLMSHQTGLAQKALDDRTGRRQSSVAISKYGTSTQECSCLFSRVFRLPCRHILMLTTELKVKTHIPFEPRWTVQHCLFGCETITAPNTGFVVIEDGSQQHQQQQQVEQQQQVRQQYVLQSGPAQQTQNNVPQQVIFCTSQPSVSVQQPVITSVVHTQGGAVLTPAQ